MSKKLWAADAEVLEFDAKYYFLQGFSMETLGKVDTRMKMWGEGLAL